MERARFAKTCSIFSLIKEKFFNDEEASRAGRVTSSAIEKIMADSEQFIADYLMSLKDLTFNSGPIIHSLTVIAKEQRREHSAAVVEAIARHLKSCPAKARLPAMYLVDSIVKNVGGVYRAEFAPRIYAMFTECYLGVSADVQQKLARLATFWADKFDPSIHRALTDFVRSRQSLKRKAGDAAMTPPTAQPPAMIPQPPPVIPFSPAQLNLMHAVQSLLMQRQQAAMMMPGDMSLLGQVQTLQQVRGCCCSSVRSVPPMPVSWSLSHNRFTTCYSP